MKESSYAVTGIQLIILLSQVVKTASIEFGINMDANYTIPLPTIMSSQALSGHRMEIISQLAPLRCLDSVINLDGLTHSISHFVAPFSAFLGAMMELSVQELVEMAMSFLDQLLIDNYLGHISKPRLIKRTK
jgi:hypothetical protein